MDEDMKTGFARVDEDMKTGFARVDEDMKTGFARVDEDMKTGFARVDEDMKTGFARVEAVEEGIARVEAVVSEANVLSRVAALEKDSQVGAEASRVEGPCTSRKSFIISSPTCTAHHRRTSVSRTWPRLKRGGGGSMSPSS
jgi:hypothetical protein